MFSRLVFSSLFFLAVFSTEAQSNQQAIGFRLGGGSYSNGEISYQQPLGVNNRLQVDFGWGAHRSRQAAHLSVNYQWLNPLSFGPSWYWFYGLGAGIATISEPDNGVIFNGSAAALSADAMAGIVYDFSAASDFPFHIGFDLKPQLYLFSPDRTGLNIGGAFSIRYLF